MPLKDRDAKRRYDRERIARIRAAAAAERQVRHRQWLDSDNPDPWRLLCREIEEGWARYRETVDIPDMAELYAADARFLTRQGAASEREP
jgi:hypothetical protein